MMAIQSELKGFDRLAAEIGGGPALLLCAFYGGMAHGAYVPAQPVEGHVIEKLIGREAFGWLCQAFGGETLCLPTLDGLRHIRSAGLVAGLSRHGVPKHLMAAACDLSTRRIEQIREQLRLEGFGDLMAATPEEERIEQ
nr:hypothetical protein [Dechloromonas sp.]